MRTSFTRDELEAARSRTVPDLLGSRTLLLFVGINPGLWTAASGAHFAHPGNRFYPALARAGIVDRVLDVRAGYDPESVAALTERGVGITNLVERTTARADELNATEFGAGVESLESKVAKCTPKVVAFVGIGAYRLAYGQKSAKVGVQDHRIHGARVWALPNPSGLNAHYSLERLADLYGQAARDAGIVHDPGIQDGVDSGERRAPA